MRPSRARHDYYPCAGCGRPTRSVYGYCRRPANPACKHGYNAAVYAAYGAVTPRPLVPRSPWRTTTTAGAAS